MSGPPTSDKEGVLEWELASARDSGYKQDSNILLFRHPKDSRDPARIGEHEVNLVTDSVDEIHSQIGAKTKHVIIAGAAHYSNDIGHLVDALVASNRNIIVTGTNVDIHGQPYGSMPDLMTLADEVILTKGPCFKYETNCNITEANRGVHLQNGEWAASCVHHFYYPDLPPLSVEHIGSFTLDLGPMFSGKTKRWRRRILNQRKKGKDLLVFSPITGARYGQPEVPVYSEGNVTLNNEETFPAIMIKNASHIDFYMSAHPRQRDIFLDEVQFMPGLYDLILKYVPRGYRFYGTGLPRGFNRKQFFDVPRLMSLADEIIMSYATCVQCGHPATENQRMKRESDDVILEAHAQDPLEVPGGADKGKEKYFYEARCLRDWKLEGKAENKYKLERYDG